MEIKTDIIQIRCRIALPAKIYLKETQKSMSLQIFFTFLKKISVKVRGTKPSAFPGELYRQFSLAELKAATNNFDDDLKIGESRSAKLYKGLMDGGSLVVAVKRLSSSSSQGIVEVFRREAQLICQLRHQNLVSFIGFCYEEDETILVYKYMTHGALYGHLFRNADPLPWKRRLEICIGVARGLHYLHAGAKYAIIHRDVKPDNILLDENWNAKLAGFWLSEIGPPTISKPKPNALTKKVSTMAGTPGYMAPENIDSDLGEISEKVDVYSLGVVLLEVLCGRKLFESNAVDEEEICLIFWIINGIKNGCVHDTIDPFLKGKIAPVCLIEFVEIALSCVYENPNDRPSMGEVEVTLELALELQEKADSVMKAVNPHAGYAYEDVSFRVSVRDHEKFFGSLRADILGGESVMKAYTTDQDQDPANKESSMTDNQEGKSKKYSIQCRNSQSKLKIFNHSKGLNHSKNSQSKNQD